MTELKRVATRIARGDWTQQVRVASGETQTVYVIDGGTMRELREALRTPSDLYVALKEFIEYAQGIAPGGREEGNRRYDAAPALAKAEAITDGSVAREATE